ncbi:MAG: glycosyltransferase family 2 protein [Armatimonadetes bacterium]|nr:glycosyltransferase family 2 protein [Armatimonadota bacterium]
MGSSGLETTNTETGVSVVIAAYNEADRIAQTVQVILDLPHLLEIIVVDDGSTDETALVAGAAGAQVIKMGRNRGKGQALNAGISKVRGDIILMLDADLASSAVEADKLLEPVFRDEADLVIAGFPVVPGRGGGMGLVVRLARWGIKRMTGERYQWPLSGQRAIRRHVLQSLLPLERGFGVEVAMTIGALRKGARVVEVQTGMDHRVTGWSWRDRAHRARQFCDVAVTLLRCSVRGR